MVRRMLVPLLLALAASPLCAQPPPLSLCIVQTLPDQATHYDPSAGPWAIEIDHQLSGRKRGSSLKLTVLAASLDKDVLPEVRRLQCAWVLQLWYNHSVDFPLSSAGAITSSSAPLNQQLGNPEPIRYKNSLFFSLWNAGTRKVLGRGSVPLPASPEIAPRGDTSAAPCAAVAQQALKWLDRIH